MRLPLVRPFLSLLPLLAVACSGGAADDGDVSDSHLTEKDLEGKVFIEKTTYTTPFAGYTRAGTETEATLAVSGIDGKALVHILRSSKDDRTVYQRLRTPNIEQAFSTDFGVDQMLWDSDSHAVREQFPFVWLSIEYERFAQDMESGERELTVGTDIMDDTYYDTADFILTKNQMEIRGRARWDTPTEIRRLLVGSKTGTEVDAVGIKRDAKSDTRNDSATADQIASLDNDIRRGFLKWGADQEAAPIRQVYEKAVSLKLLPDVGAHQSVLLLEPKVHIRQVRSRFHLGETSSQALNAVAALGPDRIAKVRALIDKARAAKKITTADNKAVAAWEKKAAAALDGSLLVERAAKDVTTNDSTQDVTATGMLALASAPAGSITDIQLESRRSVSEAQSTIYHELGDELDAIRRIITLATDRTFEDEPKRFAKWLRTVDNTALGTTKMQLGLITTMDTFIDIHAKLSALPAADRDAVIASYNTWAEQQKTGADEDFEKWKAITAADLPALGAQIQCEVTRIYQRQLQASGTAARGQWFDTARIHWIPSSSRQTQDFLIDTTDALEMYKDADWNGIADADRVPAKVLPEDKCYWGTLSNDVQIELGQETPYTNRIAELEGMPQGPDRDKQLAGATFIFNAYRDAMVGVSKLKATKILKELGKAGAPQGIEWKPIEGAKGEIAMKRLM